MNYLNEIEKEKLAAFNDDEIMKEAVRKVLLEGILECGVVKEGVEFDGRNWAYNLGGLNDFAMDDAVLGGLLKATTKGIGYLEDGFKRLSEHKREIPLKEEDSNPAV